MASSHRMSRRDFVKVVTASLGTLMGASVAVPAVDYLIDPALKASESDAWIPLGPLENYPIGEPTPFSFTTTKVNGWEKSVNSNGVFIVRKSETEVEVLSNVCTHLGCRVTWHPELQEYVCPCHNAHFDEDGNVDSGPAPRPLDNYEIKIEDGNLFIHFTEG